MANGTAPECQWRILYRRTYIIRNGAVKAG